MFWPELFQLCEFKLLLHAEFLSRGIAVYFSLYVFVYLLFMSFLEYDYHVLCTRFYYFKFCSTFSV